MALIAYLRLAFRPFCPFAVPVSLLPPLAPFVLLLMLALLMSLRFSNAHRKIGELSVQLIKADRLKDEFLARASHEFKSPLHGVLHILRSMLEDPRQPPTEGQREKLQLVVGIAERLSRLVYDILDFSRLKQGDLAVDPMPVDVRSAAETQVRIYSHLVGASGTRLVNRVPEQLPFALADEYRLGQILGNLLDNAVKHTKNGSVVVTAAEKEGMIEISVSDTGEGIEEHHLPHIFDAFWTLAEETDESEGTRGFGLGLPIVKQLVELQKGNISVVSTRGIGTTFTFTLPVAPGGKESSGFRPVQAREAAADFTLETPSYLDQDGRHTILIVDDQPVNLKVLMEALQPLGHNVIAVKNGYEAMEQIHRPAKIDLVVLDVMMPGMTGFEVCQEIRKTHSLAELPVLMVTAAIGAQDKVAAFESGANDFLPKPFDMAELKARIGSLLALKDSLAKAVDLEVAFLQSQIKPHFLFNVLNSILAASFTDVELARQLTGNLAEYLRASFRFGNMEKRISFEEEFSLIRTYVDIEKARFGDRLRFESDIAEEMFAVNLPPLIIQPLVENAIRHGIGRRAAGGKGRLTAYAADGQYWFVVEDDGVGFAAGDAGGAGHAVRADVGGGVRHSGDPGGAVGSGSGGGARPGSDAGEGGRRGGVGLRNINKRLKYEYGTELLMESEPGRGTKVTVRIPAEPALGKRGRP